MGAGRITSEEVEQATITGLPRPEGFVKAILPVTKKKGIKMANKPVWLEAAQQLINIAQRDLIRKARKAEAAKRRKEKQKKLFVLEARATFKGV